MLKTRIAVIVLLIVVVPSMYLTSVPVVKASRSSTSWGVSIWMDDNEIGNSSYVCDLIASLFASKSGYSSSSSQNFYGSSTIADDVYDYTSYCDTNYDHSMVFYKGHSMPGTTWYPGNPPVQVQYMWLKDQSEDDIVDLWINQCTQSSIHDFAFMWTCGMADYQYQYYPPPMDFTTGMSYGWLNTIVSEDTHGSPDYSGKCFISFVNQSPNFEELTQSGNNTIADFVADFYSCLSNGYSIDASLDSSANANFGCSFESCWLYTGYWRYFDLPGMPPGYYWAYIREFGDGSLTLIG
jgi:hypothetical protein